LYNFEFINHLKLVKMGLSELEFEKTTGIQLTGSAQKFLKEAARWAKILAIIGFIFIGLIVFLFLVGGLAMSSSQYPLGGMAGVAGITYVIMGIVFGALYFFPTYFLYKFSVNTLQAFEHNNSDLLSEGFRYLRNMFMYIGIATVVVIGIYLLIFIGGFLAGSLM